MKYLRFISILALFLVAGFAHATNTNDAVFTSTSNKNLSRADTASISVTGTLTLQFAVNFSGVPTDTQGLVTIYPTTASDRSYGCERGTDNKISCWSYNGTTKTNMTSTNALSTGTWYCVVYKFIPSTSMTIYFDSGCDAPPAQDAQITASIPASNNDSTGTLRLGTYDAFAATAANVYAGSMDDVRIWAENHDFTTDYNCEITGSETNLKAYWTLNNTLNDSTANGNTLTNNGTVVINDTSVPFSAACTVAAAGFAPWQFDDF